MTAPRNGKRTGGFTLLEVMLAVAIMAIALGAVFSAQAGSVKMAQRARKLGFATLLTRCKMGEIEEELAKKGLPSIYQTDSDKCCKDAPIDGFKCKWEITPIVLPDTMFGDDDEDKDGKKPAGASAPQANAKPTPATGSGSSSSSSKGGLTGLLGAAAAALGGKNEPGKDGKLPENLKDLKDGKDGQSKDGQSKDKDGKAIEKQDPNALLAGDPSRFLSGGDGNEVDGITAMAMQFVYPVLKPSFQAQIRRVTVTISWSEGEAEKTMDLTQYVVAEQPVPLATDPNDPNAQLGGTSTTGAASPTGVGSTSTLGGKP